MCLRNCILKNFSQNLILKTKISFNGTKISTSAIVQKTKLKNPSKFKKSSQDWLTRQLNDPYVKLTALNHYRARSAFKIIELNDKHKFFKPGMTVVECGCAPGAWTEAIVPLINSDQSIQGEPQGLIIALDKLVFTPVRGAVTLPCCDFTSSEASKLVLQHLEGRKVDFVLSDMAPNSSGNKSMDHDNIIQLVSLALNFALSHSSIGANFLCKIWDGFHSKNLKEKLLKFYSKVTIEKPPSSRKDSSEAFYLARGFKGLESTN